MESSAFQSTLVFDSLDIDLFVKVLAHTAFSKCLVILRAAMTHALK